MTTFRHVFLEFIKPLSVFFGRLKIAHPHKVNANDYRKIIAVLQPGMVFLSRIDLELSDEFIPGFWMHSALYAGNEKVLEAVGAGVIETDLIDFLLTKDFVCVLDPTFATTEQKQKAILTARAVLGSPYDYLFESNSPHAFYCSELITFAFEQAIAPSLSPFTYADVLGGKTVSPQSFFDNPAIFALVLQTGGGKRSLAAA